jgi:hypothetical protein
VRAIDYFDRGHDIDPARTALFDTESGEKLSFAETKAETERLAAALQKKRIWKSGMPCALRAQQRAADGRAACHVARERQVDSSQHPQCDRR